MKIESRRNARCWCNSGKKYKHCHMHRQRDKEIPLGQNVQKIKKNFKKRKICLHPNASTINCGSKIVRAHTIQRGREIRLIANASNHVLCFQPIPKDDSLKFDVRPIGHMQASTFTGFCDYHDNRIFACLEKQSFVGNKEQCFTAGYRALCHGLYQQLALVDSMDILKGSIDRGLPQNLQLQTQISLMRRNAIVRKGLKAVEGAKKVYDSVLLSQSYEDMNHCVIYF